MSDETTSDERTGACPACLNKHLLKARGYAAEVAEDASREWEFDRLLENLMLAEDHAAELGMEDVRRDIRFVRLDAEAGRVDASEIETIRLRAIPADLRSRPAGAPCGCRKKPTTENTEHTENASGEF